MSYVGWEEVKSVAGDGKEWRSIQREHENKNSRSHLLMVTSTSIQREEILLVVQSADLSCTSCTTSCTTNP